VVVAVLIEDEGATNAETVDDVSATAAARVDANLMVKDFMSATAQSRSLTYVRKEDVHKYKYWYVGR